MARSFRLRLAAWSALLAGVALAGFASIAWLAVRQAKLAELQTTVRVYAEREARRPSPPRNWARFEEMLGREMLHGRDTQQMLLLSESSDGVIIHRSAYWPAGLDTTHLPWPAVPPLPDAARTPEPSRQNGNISLPSRQPGAGGSNFPRRNGNFFSPLRRPGAYGSNFPPRGGRFPPPPDGFPGGMRADGSSPDSPPEMAGSRPARQRLDVPRRPFQVAVKPLTLSVGGETWKFALAASPYSRIAIGLSTRSVDVEMVALRNAFLLALPLALALIALGAWMISARALRPLRQINDSIRAVTAKGLDQRIPAGSEDREFSELVSEFNGMLERLEKSFHQASRFSGDAAHELRTPLTILQGQVERAITQAAPGSPMQAMLSAILDETGKLATILRKLLLLSRADAGRMRLQLERVELDGMLEALAEDAQMLGPHLKITCNAAPHLFVNADDSMLRQVLGNMVSNAIKYNLEKGWVRIDARRLQGYVVITVSNSSHGIPAEVRDRIFERFFRADASHNRNIEGTGLGLSLAREIARAHGGDLTLAVGAKNDVHFKLVLPGKNP